MNRAVAIAAVFSLLVLVACGAWLFLNDRAASRFDAVSRDNQRAAEADHTPVAQDPANREDAKKAPGESAANTPNPEPEAKPETKPEDPAPGPKNPKPDFRRTPDTGRRQPIELEQKRAVLATITGRVVSQQNVGVANAGIFAEVIVQRRFKGAPDPESTPLQKVAVSAGNGEFIFHVSLEVYTSATVTTYVSARCQGYGPSAPVALDLAQDGTSSTTLILNDGGAISGRVVDTHGNPVAGVKVMLGKPPQRDERPLREGECVETLTDASGAFVFADVTAREYPIGVLSYAHNYRSGPKSATVEAAGSGKLEDIVVEVLISLRVQVAESSGERVHGVCTITFRDGQKLVNRLSTQVPENGVIVLGYPPAGTFDVTVHVEGYLESPTSRHSYALGATTDMGTVTLTRDPNYVKQH